MKYLASVLAGIVMAGCAVGPDYKVPGLGTPLGWMGLGQSNSLLADAGDKTVSLAWWKAFQDPILESLMEQALARNGDLRVAQARVQEARGVRLAANADLLPAIDGTASGSRGNANSAGRLATTTAATLDASWEIDLFGGNRRAAEAARARLGGTVAEARATRLRLLAEVAQQYLDVRRLQQQLGYARQNLDDQKKTLELVQAQAREGVASGLVVAQNEALVATTAARIPLLEADLTNATNALGVLVGAQPVEIAQTVGKPQPVPVVTPQILVATPASVIARRPDVRAAERALAAATADQGVALANWFRA